MNNAQIINDLIMKCAEYKKDAEYLAGERDYWKQQAQQIDSVSDGCDTESGVTLRDLFGIWKDTSDQLEADSRKKLIEEIMRNMAAEVTNGGVEIHGAIPIEDALKSAMQRVDDLLTDDEPETDVGKSIQNGEKDKFDTREKLEEDVRQYANPEGNTGTLGACWERKMIEFLDRQAAITEREYFDSKCHDCQDAHDRQTYRNIEKIAELKAKVDALEAELNSTCTLAYDGKWLTCSNCGESLQWFGVRTVYKTDGKQERALGVEGVRYCPFCGARIVGGESE